MIRTARDLPEGHWIRRDGPLDASLRPYAEDRAVSLVMGAVLDAVALSGLTRADIAHALGVTPSYVSQVLNGYANVTLKTLGAILWACGCQVQTLGITTLGTARADLPDAEGVAPN